MATRKKPSNSGGWFVLVGIAILGSAFAYVKYAPQVPARQEASKVVATTQHEAATTTTAPERTDTKNVSIKTPYYSGDDLKFTEKTEQVPKNADPIVFAVNRFLEKSHIAPADAKAKTATLHDGLITIDFSPSFETTYGTEDERTMINGLIATLAQFKEIKQFQFTVSGKPLDTLGNVDLSKPLPLDGPVE